MLDRYYQRIELNPLGLFGARLFEQGLAPEPGAGSDFQLALLPPFLRSLLVTDGTVTRTLEAYYWEPVGVENVRNRLEIATRHLAWLDLHPGDEVISRQVLLRGANSRRIYACAHSLIRSSQLPDALRERLLLGRLGIGELIRECGLESFRQLLEFGSTRDMAEFGGPATVTDCVYRSYRIMIGHAPAILVSECFPLQVFSAAQDPG